MQLSIYHSRRFDKLADELGEQILEQLRRNPLKAVTVVIPTHAVANYLSNRYAETWGISMQIDFIYWDSWLRQLIQSTPEKKFSQTAWVISLMDRSDQDSEFGDRLSDYWDRVDLIKKYLEFRPNWIDEWETEREGEYHQFRRDWGNLTKNSSMCLPIERLIWKEIKRGGSPNELGRQFLFGFWSLSPLQLHFLQWASTKNPIDIYSPFPVDSYLGDITKKGENQFIRKGDENLNRSNYRLIGHLGTTAREYQSLVLDSNVPTSTISPDSEPESLLKSLQAIISDPGFVITSKTRSGPPKESICILSCPSKFRELESLKSEILSALADNPEWNLEDFHIYCPNIEAYLPWISSIFDSATAEESIPIHIRSTLDHESIPSYRCLLASIQWCGSRKSRENLMNFIRSKPVTVKFGLHTDDCTKIDRWLAASEFFSEFDFNERASPLSRHYDWDAAQKRVIKNWLAGDDLVDFRGDHIEMDDSELVYRFLTITKHLDELSRFWNDGEISFQNITRFIEKFIESFLDHTDFSFEKIQIQEAIAQLDSTTLKESSKVFLTSADLQFLLKKVLRRLPSPQSLYRGSGVQFASIENQSLTPAKFIGILGLEEGNFPRKDIYRSNDLMKSHRKPGDPSNRNDDLYWILQSIVYADAHWHASFCGHNLSSDEVVDPCNALQVIIEGVKSIEPGFEVKKQAKFSHSAENFRRNAPHPSSNLRSFEIANILKSDPSNFLDFSQWERKPEAPENFSILEIISFFKNPARYFSVHRLHANQVWEQDDSNTVEPQAASIDGLTEYFINRAGIQEQLSGETGLFRANNTLIPAGNSGRSIVAELEPHWLEQLDGINPNQILGHSECPIKAYEIETSLGQFRGLCPALPRERLFCVHTGSLKPAKPRLIIEAWLWSLSCSMSPEYRDGLEFNLVGRDQEFTWKYNEPDEAGLEWVFRTFISGTQTPIPLFPETSLKHFKSKSSPEGLKDSEEWRKESSDPFVRWLRTPSLDGEFAKISGDLWEHVGANLVGKL